MILSIQGPVQSGLRASLKGGISTQAPCVVIYQPATLCAEALEVLVYKHTRWQVACATTSVGVATAAVLACRAAVLIFEVQTGTAIGAAALIRRLRLACPRVALMLVTEHSGAGFLRAVADVEAVIHKCDRVDALRSALQSVERRHPYRSPKVATCLLSAGQHGRHQPLTVLHSTLHSMEVPCRAKEGR